MIINMLVMVMMINITIMIPAVIVVEEEPHLFGRLFRLLVFLPLTLLKLLQL